MDTLPDDYFIDPHRTYRDWRTQGGVHRMHLPGGLPGWLVTGYAEGRAALADPRLRKSAAGADELITQHGFPSANRLSLTNHMLNSDPPDHTRLRRLVNTAFTSGAVAALRPRIEEIAGALLDDMATRDEVDLLAAFAEPLPITVICELLGVPFTDRDDFRSWTGTLLSVAVGVDRSAAGKAMLGYLTELVAAKRAQPAADLLSALVQARDDDDRLTERELVATAFLLLVAGHETTVNLIGNGMYALLRDTAQLDALRADLSRVPAAVEEFLRYDGPVNVATLRYTAEPVVLGGTEIPAGEFVHVVLSSANRDDARFPSAGQLDIGRDAGGHVAFGHGIHYCVGAPLARLEAEVAFTRLLARFPRLRLATEEPLGWHESMRIRGLAHLPVRLK